VNLSSAWPKFLKRAAALVLARQPGWK